MLFAEIVDKLLGLRLVLFSTLLTSLNALQEDFFIVLQHFKFLIKLLFNPKHGFYLMCKFLLEKLHGISSGLKVLEGILLSRGVSYDLVEDKLHLHQSASEDLVCSDNLLDQSAIFL